MNEIRLFVAILFAVFCITNIESVSFIKKCKSNDSKCATESTRVAIPIVAAGLPEYNIKPVDPIYVERIDASTHNLKLILSKVTVTDINKCTIKETKRDKPKSKLFMTFLCSTYMDGQYEMKGQLLSLPIEGKGGFNIKLRKAEISIDIDLEDRNDKWNIKNFKHSIVLKDKSQIVFENLFNGNDVLAKAARHMIANHSNDIIYDVGLPVLEVVGGEIFKEVNKLFNAVPANELSID